MERFLCLLSILSLGCSQPEPLPVYFEVPHFELTAQDGEAFSRGDLLGDVWVADFVFTSCRGPCPLMSRHMKKLQDAVIGLEDVQLVSISVDPEVDTPEKLREYAGRYSADPKRWNFLTGGKQQIYELIFDGFRLAVDDGARAAGGKPGPGIITHSVKFALVDREGRIRGYYPGNEADVVEQILPDIQRLLAENSTNI